LQGVEQRDLAACTQEDCGVFYAVWWKLWRKMTATRGLTPVISPQERTQLYGWLATAEAGPKREAVSVFLEYWSPQTVEELFR